MSIVDELRLFTLNVSGPSLTRAARILEFLSALDPDVLVLTETRGAPGTQHLLDSYRFAGYEVSASPTLAGGERGVAIAHRVRPAPQRAGATVTLAHRLLVVRLGLQNPITLVGAYVPSRDASPEKIERKQTFLTQMVALLRTLSPANDLILMGDLNVVSRSHEPRYSSFRAWEYESLSEIAGCGLVDAFAELHPGVQAHSWVGRTGDGYRYDYSFLSGSLAGRLRRCEYLDDTRLLGLSDHAGMLMTIRSPDTHLVDVQRPEVVGEPMVLGL